MGAHRGGRAACKHTGGLKAVQSRRGPPGARLPRARAALCGPEGRGEGGGILHRGPPRSMPAEVAGGPRRRGAHSRSSSAESSAGSAAAPGLVSTTSITSAPSAAEAISLRVRARPGCSGALALRPGRAPGARASPASGGCSSSGQLLLLRTGPSRTRAPDDDVYVPAPCECRRRHSCPRLD